MDCPTNPSFLDYCQRHYIVIWKSATDSFHDFAVSPIALGEHYDITFAAHTSYESTMRIIYRIKRLDRVPLIMKQWKGYVFMIVCKVYRPIVIALYLFWSEIHRAEMFLTRVNSTQLTVILYVVDDRRGISPGDNCVYKRVCLCVCIHLI